MSVCLIIGHAGLLHGAEGANDPPPPQRCKRHVGWTSAEPAYRTVTVDRPAPGACCRVCGKDAECGHAVGVVNHAMQSTCWLKRGSPSLECPANGACPNSSTPLSLFERSRGMPTVFVPVEGITTATENLSPWPARAASAWREGMCLGTDGDGIPLPGEGGEDAVGLANTPGECASTDGSCTTAWLRSITHLVAGDRGLHPAWNYAYESAAWGAHLSGYFAFAKKQRSERGESVSRPLLDHLALHSSPGAVVTGDSAPVRWFAKVETFVKSLAPQLCAPTNERQWVDVAHNPSDPVERVGPQSDFGVLSLRATQHNLAPLARGACTHTLVYDVPHNCSGGMEVYLVERLKEGLLTSGMRTELEVALKETRAQIAEGKVDKLARHCGNGGLLPRAVALGGPKQHSRAVNVLCTYLYSYWPFDPVTGPNGHLQMLNNYATKTDHRLPAARVVEERQRKSGNSGVSFGPFDLHGHVINSFVVHNVLIAS
jgi:hypothetical protein